MNQPPPPQFGQMPPKFGLLLSQTEFQELFHLLQSRIESMKAEGRASGDPSIKHRIATLHNLLARLAMIAGIQLPEESTS